MQAVERNLAQAIQRAEKAERKLAEVQAELDRRKVVLFTQLYASVCLIV